MDRHLRLPFVVTAAGLSAAAACGGSAVLDGEAPPGSGGSGASSSGSTGPSGSSTGPSGAGGSVDCPASPPDGYTPCMPSSGSCSYEVACQSGEVTLTFSCPDGLWELAPTPCLVPYDSCPGTEYYCADTWWMPNATNPPAPCPDTKPPAGSACFTGGMGGVWEHCGYRCTADPVTGWTVASCVDGPNGQSWQYDGVCPPE